MEADMYTLRCIPHSQALYVTKGCAQCLSALCLCTHPTAVGSDIPHAIPWAHSQEAAAVGLPCSLTTDTFSASMARVHPAAEVSSELSHSTSVVPALHSAGLVLSLPAQECAGGWQHRSPWQGLG